MVFYWIAWFLVRCFYFLAFGFSVKNTKAVPKDGAFLICANHKSNWDPPAIAVGIRRRLGFLAKAELFKNKAFGAFLKYVGAFPVKRGAGDIGAMKTAVSVIKAGKPLLIFPEGTRVKKGQVKKANNGAVRLAIMCGVPILPVGIGGEYRVFGRVKINIGKPVTYDEYKGKKLSDEEIDKLTQDLMDKIYALANN